MASVEYLVNPAEVQAAWADALGRGCQRAPFDRLEWWSALHELCLPGEEPLLALASEGEARCALALMHRPGSGQLRSLANWYSFWARPVFACRSRRRQRHQARQFALGQPARHPRAGFRNHRA